MELKAFFEMAAVAVLTLVASLVLFLLRSYGFGGNYPLFFGVMLLFCILLLFVIFLFASRYTRPFQQIDEQLSAFLRDESSEIRLPRGLSSTEQKLNALKQAMEKRLFCVQLAEQQKTIW